jgi:chromosome segregation ATPase
VENTKLLASIEELKREAQKFEAIEMEYKKEIRTLNGQLERSRHEMEYVFTSTFAKGTNNTTSSMTQSFPEGETPDTQAKLAALSSLHQQATTELATLKSDFEDLTRRLSDTTNKSKLVIADFTKENKNLVMELRWAKQGREGAEKAEQRAKKELEEFYKFQDSGVNLPVRIVDQS